MVVKMGWNRPVKDSRPKGSNIGAGADTEQDDGQQRLEVEESRHDLL